jgi:hypothetical protein
MTVRELIELLAQFESDLPVRIVSDLEKSGADFAEVESVEPQLDGKSVLIASSEFSS